jgi:hypothetical protein
MKGGNIYILAHGLKDFRPSWQGGHSGTSHIMARRERERERE